jgi:AIPR protein
VSFDVALHDWGSVQEPHIAYYGQIEAEDLAAWWSEHGARLLAKNLRKFIGDSEVNNSIVDTLLADPENFWYFNNGVTVLCTSLEKKPIGGGDRRSGQFRCEGISIVNGAQTVGCIGTAQLKSPEQVAKARVMVRFISLADCPPEFASEVTRATNTQNRIERRDFVSLDKEQERLQTELRLEGHQYALKTGDIDPLPDSGCSVTEATVALACALADSGLAVQAKREIGRLWENIERPPYRLIFNGSVSGLKLWRCVEVLRAVEAELKTIQDGEEGKTRSIAVHGNRLILHAVLQRLPVAEFSDPQHDMNATRAQTILVTHKVFESMTSEVEKQFPGSYVASLFKNATKCKAIVEAID